MLDSSSAATFTAAGATVDRSIEAAVQLANKEFIKGFVAGQAILCVLIFFLLKVFLFRNSDETRAELARRLERRIAVPKPKSVGAQQRRNIDSLIMGKIGYDPALHPFETCDWLNILLAQALSSYRTNAAFKASIISLLDSLANNDKKPSFVGPISITEFSLGEEYPILKNARVRFSEPDSSLKIQVDFSFDDQITLGVDTQLIINWPQQGVAALPVSLAVSIVKFSGTLMLQYVTEPTMHIPPLQGVDGTHSHETWISVSVMDDFLLDFEVRSLLGHRTKVKDLPKLTGLICNRMRAIFVDELVWPSCKKWKLPG
eukprot:jgi/Hompol1/2282/HPOL_005924-RA